MFSAATEEAVDGVLEGVLGGAEATALGADRVDRGIHEGDATGGVGARGESGRGQGERLGSDRRRSGRRQSRRRQRHAVELRVGGDVGDRGAQGSASASMAAFDAASLVPCFLDGQLADPLPRRSP